MKKVISLLAVSLLVFSFSFNSAQAAQIQIVPACAASGNCSTCDLIAMAIDLANTMAAVAGSLALIMLIIGGGMWIFSGASEELIEKGKKIIKGTFTGLVIMIFAWMAVNFIIHALSGSSVENATIFSRKWWNPECTVAYPVNCKESDIGDSCIDKYHVCQSASDKQGSGDCGNSCQCVSYCQSFAEQSDFGYECVGSSVSCSSGYEEFSVYDACGKNQKCCLTDSE